MRGRKEKYNEGKIGTIIDTLVAFIKANPQAATNPQWLKTALAHNYPELKNPKDCPNCGASMVQYEFVFDCLDAVLLLTMASEVMLSIKAGHSFSDANAVRIQKLPTASYAMKSRTSQMSKLGLVTQCRTKAGKRIPGLWLITKRGWAALRGEAVPKRVISWRNAIQERPEELITLSEAFKVHSDKVAEAIMLNKLPKADYRRYFSDYNPSSWAGYGETHQGRLI